MWIFYEIDSYIHLYDHVWNVNSCDRSLELLLQYFENQTQLGLNKKIFVGSKTLNKFHTNGCMHIHMIIRYKQSRALNKAAIFIDLFLLINLDLIHVLINKSLHSFLAKNPSYSYGHSSWFYLTQHYNCNSSEFFCFLDIITYMSQV